jgi:hypothetical protein
MITGCNGKSNSINTLNEIKPDINNMSVDDSTFNSSTISYEEAIRKEISSRLHVDTAILNVVFSKTIQSGIVSQIAFKTSVGTTYEGNVYATIDECSNWTVKDLSCAPVDRTYPFTRMMTSGNLNSDQKYSIVSGTINDEKIVYINIRFFDGIFAEALIDPKYNTYIYIREDTASGVKNVQGISKEGRLIYQY